MSLCSASSQAPRMGKEGKSTTVLAMCEAEGLTSKLRGSQKSKSDFSEMTEGGTGEGDGLSEGHEWIDTRSLDWLAATGGGCTKTTDKTKLANPPTVKINSIPRNSVVRHYQQMSTWEVLTRCQRRRAATSPIPAREDFALHFTFTSLLDALQVLERIMVVNGWGRQNATRRWRAADGATRDR
ncbi:MAG: hypothetical protein Q9214_007531 [Letrouitia sp. 1 TL-2023]